MAKENLDVLRASSKEATSDFASAAAVEHEALLKAQADLQAIKSEVQKLTADHAQVLETAQQQIQALKDQAVTAESLAAQVEELNKANEEKATKVSELEIEILEIKEDQETAGDEYTKTLARIKSLEEELAAATAAVHAAAEAAKAKEEEFGVASTSASQAHSDELSKANAEYSTLLSQLKALEGELAAAIAVNEQAKVDTQAAADEHQALLAEATDLHLEKEQALTEEIQKITAELEVCVTFMIVMRNCPTYRTSRAKSRSTMLKSTLSKPSMINCFKMRSSVPRSDFLSFTPQFVLTPLIERSWLRP